MIWAIYHRSKYTGLSYTSLDSNLLSLTRDIYIHICSVYYLIFIIHIPDLRHHSNASCVKYMWEVTSLLVLRVWERWNVKFSFENILQIISDLSNHSFYYVFYGFSLFAIDSVFQIFICWIQCWKLYVYIKFIPSWIINFPLSIVSCWVSHDITSFSGCSIFFLFVFQFVILYLSFYFIFLITL